MSTVSHMFGSFQLSLCVLTLYMHNLKTTGCVWMFCILNDCSTIRNIPCVVYSCMRDPTRELQLWYNIVHSGMYGKCCSLVLNCCSAHTHTHTPQHSIQSESREKMLDHLPHLLNLVMTYQILSHRFSTIHAHKRSPAMPTQQSREKETPMYILHDLCHHQRIIPKWLRTLKFSHCPLMIHHNFQQH